MPTEIASRADVSYQDEFWLGRESGGVWGYNQILGVETMGMPERTPEEIDVTHQQIPGRARETMSALMASADVSQEMQFWAGDTEQGYLNTLAELTESGSPENLRVVFIVSGILRTYRAHVTSFNVNGPAGDKRVATTNFKIFERIVPNSSVGSAEVAPSHVVPPYIIGVSEVGRILPRGRASGPPPRLTPINGNPPARIFRTRRTKPSLSSRRRRARKSRSR